VVPDAFFSQLQRLGLPLRESGGYHGFSLALGSAEVPLLQLTNAYRALANGGQLTPVRGTSVQARAEAPVQAIDARAAFIVGDILSDPMARAPTFGTDSVLATRFWTAVKTGTTCATTGPWAGRSATPWACGWAMRAAMPCTRSAAPAAPRQSGPP
jgi:penicillin-binding protein 1C